MRCGLSLAKTITAPHLIFAVTYAVRYIRCSLNDLKLVYFSNFRFFLPNPKLIFLFVLVQILNYWASFSLFWVGFLNQHLIGLSNYFFFWKTRVIKLLIIYLILKILIYRRVWCGTVTNRIAPCGVVQCSAILLAVQCTYAILRMVLVWFLRFVWFIRFGEHS